MTFIPADGQITSLQMLPNPLSGGEVMEIVQPGTAALGNSYQVTTSELASFFAASSASIEVILGDATAISPYLIKPADGVLLFNKIIGTPSYVLAPIASAMSTLSPILIKDLLGDAATNNITINFTGGQLCDGQPAVLVDNAYGWVRIVPAPGGAAWYQA